MSNIQKVLLTGKSRTTSADGRVLAGDHEGGLNIRLSAPGNSAAGGHAFDAIALHPTAEQLFGGAWRGSQTILAGQGQAAGAGDGQHLHEFASLHGVARLRLDYWLTGDSGASSSAITSCICFSVRMPAAPKRGITEHAWKACEL